MATFFFIVDYSKKSEAISIILVISMHKILCILCICIFGYINLHVLSVLAIVFFFFTMFQVYKKYDYISDEYNSDYVYLIFYKPVTLRQWFISLFGCPFAGMASVINGKVYKLMYGSGNIVCTDIDMEHLKEHYYIINTRVLAKDVKHVTNDLLQGTAYNEKLFNMRLNCVLSQQALLGLLPYKWHLKYRLDFLPSYYLAKRV